MAMASDKQLVLVVDDDPDLLRVMRDSLADAGYEVATATNGQHAIGMLGAVSPSVVVCDVEMPIMNGFQFCEAF